MLSQNRILKETITITTPGGEKFSGYLSKPEQGKKSPGIVLIPEIFGVNKSIREAADRFAGEGYLVLAPDLFWRLEPNLDLSYEGKDLEKAFNYYHRFDEKQGMADILCATNTLRNQKECEGHISVMGFCLGGKLAYLTASSGKVESAIAFYGGGIPDHINLIPHINCPLLMHFGEEDEMIPLDQVTKVKQACNERSNITIYTYPKAGHAFYNADRVSYNPEAAELAHRRTIAFLTKEAT